MPETPQDIPADNNDSSIPERAELKSHDVERSEVQEETHNALSILAGPNAWRQQVQADMKRLSSSTDIKDRMMAARGISLYWFPLPVEFVRPTLRHLAHDPDLKVRVALAGNQSLGMKYTDVTNNLFQDPEPAVRLALANNRMLGIWANTFPDEVVKGIFTDASEEVRVAAAKNDILLWRYRDNATDLLSDSSRRVRDAIPSYMRPVLLRRMQSALL